MSYLNAVTRCSTNTMKAKHTQGGLMPASTHVYEKASCSHREGFVEVIHKLAIVVPFAYLLPTHRL